MEKSCCGKSEPNKIPGEGMPWISGHVDTPAGKVGVVTTEWSRGDFMGAVRCRLSGFRMSYEVEPGLYAAGNPTSESPVMISANYKLSFDHLRRALKGVDAWILVIDTKGINVWCAAGKGTFGTDELVKRIRECGLEKVVKRRRIIVPQLGAPGIASHEIVKETGFRVDYGPVRASDISDYIKNNFRATEQMRKVRFTFPDRIVLIPMEFIPGLKYLLFFAIAIMAFTGLDREGVIFYKAAVQGGPLVLLGAVALITGTVLTPALLPYIPFRSFALKGWIIGFAALMLLLPISGIHNPLTFLFSIAAFPAFSSFMALNFTGSTPFAGISGVKKEMKVAIPAYISIAVIAALLILTQKGLEIFRNI